MKTVTFRSQIANAGQERVKLTTLKGKTGYRIKTLQVISESPTSKAPENILKIYSVKQTTVDAVVDFTDQTLLGVAFLKHGSTNTTYDTEIIVFDGTTFNQDIYITSIDPADSSAMNYYLELEVIDLSDLEATFHTLQNIRTVAERTA